MQYAGKVIRHGCRLRYLTAVCDNRVRRRTPGNASTEREPDQNRRFDAGRIMGKRITIRIDDQSHEKLQNRSQETGLDFSFLVRDALGRYLSDAGTNHVMPAEALALTAPYRAWSGDLRAELRKQLLALLALSHTTAGQFPRTPGVREAYIAILEAYHRFKGV
jgi:hypothetical protein